MENTEETKRFRSVPGMHVCTSQLIDRIKDGKAGDVLTDEELSRLCGRNTCVGGDGYGYLNSAINHVLKQYGIVWKRERGANAIKCLEPEEIISTSEQDRKHIHRVGRRTVRRLGTVDIEQLPPTARKAHSLQFAQMATIAAFSSKNTQKKLEVREKVEPLNMAKMIEMWPSGNKAGKKENANND